MDFTSALYLGLRHPSRSLRSWSALTTGAPAALMSPRGAGKTAQALADLIGCERTILLPSTLHAFWDLFGLLATQNIAIYLDAESYPIMHWGGERAVAHGVPLRLFPHHDVERLRRLLRADMCKGIKPVIAVDGFCPACGTSAPVKEYLALARKHKGYLLLDDTQALGVFGQNPQHSIPYGLGGGGSLRLHNIYGPEVIVVSSLAKGFGVPVTVLAGSRNLVNWFANRSETRIHCSPPSVAVIHAVEHALQINAAYGDQLRRHLARLVLSFSRMLAAAGIRLLKGLFPVQTLLPENSGLDVNAVRLHDALLDCGIRSVLHHGHSGRRAQLSFLLTARHELDDIVQSAEVLRRILCTEASIEVNHDHRLPLPCRKRRRSHRPLGHTGITW
ncbi:MAG: pyridoxal phosphate-dependent aminotransferase family protein [Candidatus Electrothrix sp. AR4]|nr:pyridoxal phosphate-dependent aminotransferase family protein [Candidatus Electrothrix sp. AR4]